MNKKIFTYGGVGLFIVAIGVFGILYKRSATSTTAVADQSAQTTAANQEEVTRIIAEVGKLMVLPANEEATIATVVEPDKLKDQPFFANAEKGDRVLIYPVSRKAILYRESINKIIEVAPINIGNDQTPAPVKK